MKLMTRKDFAAMLGIRYSSLSGPIGRGVLRQTEDFMIDVDDPTNQLFISRSQEKFKTKHTAQQFVQPPPAEPPKRKPGRPAKGTTPLELATPDELLALNIAKLQAEVRQKELKNAELVRKLIPRTMVDRLFSRFITTVATHLLTAGDRLSLQVLGIVGSDDAELRTKLKVAIERDTEQALSAMKHVINDFATEVETSSVEYDMELDD